MVYISRLFITVLTFISYFSSSQELHGVEKLPSPEICPPYIENGSSKDNKERFNCINRNSKKFKNAWEIILVNSIFSQSNNGKYRLEFKPEGILDGFLPLTNDAGEGIKMDGIWELNWGDNNSANVSIYAGQFSCTFTLNKKEKYYWFERESATHRNICPSTLMSRWKRRSLLQ